MLFSYVRKSFKCLSPPIHFSFCWCYPTKKSVTEESVTTTHPPVLFAFLVLWSCDENHSYLYSNLYLLQGKYYLLIILFFCRKGELLLTGSVWTIGTCILFSLNCIKKKLFFSKVWSKVITGNNLYLCRVQQYQC